MSYSASDSMVGKRYILHDQLGEGGMGAVYRATDRLGENAGTVALKRVTTPTDKLEFTSGTDAVHDESVGLRLALANEFKVLASLRHPHIISVLDYGFDAAHQPYFTMNLLENPKTLFQAGQEQALSIKFDLLIAMLQALAYLHRRGVVHRDLKPGNVMVTSSGDTKNHLRVLDFGLSVVSSHEQNDLMEMTAGTLAYMAPELFQGANASRESDLYAVGIMAFELLAGRHPFDTTHVGNLLDGILHQQVDLSLLKVNDETAQVVGRLLDKDPANRFHDAVEVIESLCKAAGLVMPPETLEIRDSFLQAAQFVARDQEFAQLSGVLTQAIEGQGSAWLIGGESGIGKSRLLDEMRTVALVQGVLVLRGQGVSEGSSPYQLWRDVLRWLILVSEIEPDEAAILKLFVPDTAKFVDFDISDAPQLDPQGMQNRLIAVVMSILQRQKQPLMMILEDVHWAGGESLVMLDRISRMIGDMPILIIASYRDDEFPDLPGSVGEMQVLKLPRLTKSGISELSKAMLGDAGQQPQIIELLEKETEGNIFFAVEIVRSLAEEVGQLSQIAKASLPERVLAGGIQRIIERSLARVPEQARPLLQLAAVAAREVDLKVMRALQPTLELDTWLSLCANAAVLDIQDNHWRFSHDKLREGMLVSIPDGERPLLHHQIAQAIENVYPDSSDQYAALAHHWRMADDVVKELHYATLAGEFALRNNANSDAARFFSRALDILKDTPDSLERIQKELPLQINLGVVLLATKGYTAPEVKQAWTQAHELSRQLGFPPQLFQVMWGLWSFYIVQAKLTQASELAQQMLTHAETSNDEVHFIVAHWVTGVTLWGMGEFDHALEHLTQTVDRYDAQKHSALAFLFGQDPCVTCLIFSAHCLWPLGYPDRAMEKTERAITLATEIGHSFSQAFATATQLVIAARRQDSHTILQEAPKLIGFSIEHGFPLWIAWTTSLMGWAMAQNGNYAEGIPQIDQGIAIVRMIGAGIEVGHTQTLQARAYGQAGRADEGLTIIDRALEAIASGDNEDRSAEAELYRVKGELLRTLGLPEVEANFQQAIAVGQQQNAKLWELRATMSLCRLWQAQEKTAEAREKLSTIYSWFTEGFDTLDLKLAKILLAELQ